MIPARSLPRVPGFFAHVFLLWRLRLAGALSQRRGRLVSGLAFALGFAPAVPLGILGYQLMTWAPLATSPLWSTLAFDLLAFVTTAVWIAWPILSAGVDDHSELRRYAGWPIQPTRLLFASTLAGLVEPLSVVVLSPLLGAAAGLVATQPQLPAWGAAVLVLAFAVFSAAWSRAGLHGVLNVLRRRRSAGAVGGFFLFVLLGSLFLRPVDVSWLAAMGGNVGALNPEFAVQAAVGLSRVPTGYLGEGLRQLAAGRPLGALLELGGLAFFAAAGLLLAYALLVRFHRGPLVIPAPRRAYNPFVWTPSRFTTLLMREALDLLRNPRARLLFFVPFLLAVALRLLSARALVQWWVGPNAEAWLVGGLCLYGAVVFSLSFMQNAFGYDGHGLALLLAAPLDLGEVLRAKNLVHASAALIMSLLLAAFYRLYFGAGGVLEHLLALTATTALLPVMLIVGNFTSVRFATRYHAGLERRDRQPRAAVAAGMGASAMGAMPFVFALGRAGDAGPDFETVALVAGAAAVSWGAYLVLQPRAEAYLRRHREEVLRAVTRG